MILLSTLQNLEIDKIFCRERAKTHSCRSQFVLFQTGCACLSKNHTLVDAVKLILEKSIGKCCGLQIKIVRLALLPQRIYFLLIWTNQKAVSHDFIVRVYQQQVRTAEGLYKHWIEFFRAPHVQKADITIIERKDGAFIWSWCCCLTKGKRPFS